jgi:subtilisin family serine protease
VVAGATNSSDTLASWSDYGTWIDLSAPGDTILTTMNGGGYEYWSGTSISSPIAAGVAALVLSLQPALANSALVSLLESNSDALGTPGYDQYYGWGRVNAYKAVLAAKNISIASPMSGAVLAGIANLQGTATDNVGVTKVEFYLDTQLVATGSSGSFLFSWETTTAANGQSMARLSAPPRRSTSRRATTSQWSRSVFISMALRYTPAAPRLIRITGTPKRLAQERMSLRPMPGIEPATSALLRR